MSPQDYIILLSTKIHPSTGELQELNNQIAKVDNWDIVVKNLIQLGVGPLFYSKIKLLKDGKLIQKNAVEKLKQTYYLTLSRGMVMYTVFQRAMNALKANGIEVIALKGVYLADMLYVDIALRQFSDIDLLIKEEDGEKSKSVLKDVGFYSLESIEEELGIKSKILHYPPMLYNNVSVELHIRLHKDNNNYNIITDKVWQNAEMTTIHGVDVKVLDLSDMLIYTCVHLDKHFIYGDVSFTGFNDIVNILDIFADKLEWDKIESRSKEYKCEAVVFKYLMLVNHYYNVLIPEEIELKYKLILTNSERKLFVNYLNGYKFRFSLPAHFNTVVYEGNTMNKISYIFKMLFPSRDFMIHTYGIKNKNIFWFYYPYRHWQGLKGLWKLVRK